MNLKIKKVTFATVTFSSVVMWIGFFAWRNMFNNFAVDVFDASAVDVGLIQSAREIPGLLAFGVGVIAIYLTESKIASLSIVTLGIGIILCGMSTSIAMLAMATVLMSFGFHYFEPTNASQLLLLSENHQLGSAQGKLRSYESMAGLAGGAIVLVMTLFLDYRMTYYLIGGIVLLVGLYLTYALPANRGKTENRKMKLKKKYSLYYVLSFLRGCRRHIFTTFAIFLLVKNHGLDITTITIILFVNNFITIFTNRYIGNISDRIGERFVLVLTSLLLFFIFLGYAYISFLPLLILFYVIDNVLFGSSIALRSYLRKIAPTEDITSCLSFGMTANHVTAVVIPIAFGVAWSQIGYQIPFIAGALIVFVDMLFAMRIPKDNNIVAIETN
ncbi:MAG: MFS transporter [Calditrichaeota bacterium]|nr:MAG: MFS transporter [Calditrichota bacterium]